MDRRKFAKTALGAIAGGALASTANAKPEQVEAVKPTDKPRELNPKLQNDLAQEQIKVIQSKRGYRHQGKKGANGKTPLEGKCTSLLLFADVHLVYEHLAVIRDFYNTHKKYIDDAVHLGDTVGNYLIPPFDFWDVFPNALNIIGNHDTDTGEKQRAVLSDRDKYDTYFKKYISSWNVVQPENAEAEGKCYWYKDYNNDVRLIGIDCMRASWGTNKPTEAEKKQIDWFKATLADALEKKLQVVVATHVPPTMKTENLIECNFTSLDYRGIGSGLLLDKFVFALDDFITKGGSFVAWICGHQHHDLIGFATNAKQKQLVFILECATDFNWWTDANHVRGTETAGCWTMFAIESLTNVIKLTRFGNNYDHYLRHKGTLCYDYKNHKIINQF